MLRKKSKCRWRSRSGKSKKTQGSSIQHSRSEGVASQRRWLFGGGWGYATTSKKASGTHRCTACHFVVEIRELGLKYALLETEEEHVRRK